LTDRRTSGRRVLGITALAAVLALGGALTTATDPPTGLASSRSILPRAHRAPAVTHEVYGYLPYWELNRGTARLLDYGSLSTIAFFAIPVTGSGALDRRSPGYRAYLSSAAAAVTNAAHRRGVRVVPTFQLFDHGRLATLRRLLGSRRAQNRFISQAVALVVQRKADGANLDFEPVPSSLAPAFGSMVGRLSRRLHARVMGAQLVVTTPPIFSPRLVARLAPVVDRLFVMAYDYHWPASRRPGSVAPLSSGPHNVARTIAAYTRFVVPAKLILGLPYYGYSWPTVGHGSAMRVRTNPARYGGVHGVTYANIVRFLRTHPSVRARRDPAGGGSFRYWDARNRTAREVHYEDPVSVRQKADFAIAQGLAGIGIWTLGGDGGPRPMATAVRSRFVGVAHRVVVAARARPAALVRGSLLVRYTVGLANRGSVPERGYVTWRVLTAQGTTLASGKRLAIVYGGRRLTLALATRLGRPWQRAAGIYRIVVRFESAGHRWQAAVRFNQRY
jgi:hypothetical protein